MPWHRARTQLKRRGMDASLIYKKLSYLEKISKNFFIILKKGHISIPKFSIKFDQKSFTIFLHTMQNDHIIRTKITLAIYQEHTAEFLKLSVVGSPRNMQVTGRWSCDYINFPKINPFLIRLSKIFCKIFWRFFLQIRDASIPLLLSYVLALCHIYGGSYSRNKIDRIQLLPLQK